MCKLCYKLGGLEAVRHLLRLQRVAPAFHFSLPVDGARVVVRRGDLLVGRPALVQLHSVSCRATWTGTQGQTVEFGGIVACHR